MAVSIDKPASKRRAMSKQARREQLIQATIKCIAKNGLSGTTMADITREAGLSLGIVNLHFESKEKLLIEADAFPPSPADATSSPTNPATVNLYTNIQRLGLDVQQIAPLHGRLVPMTALLRAVGKQ